MLNEDQVNAVADALLHADKEQQRKRAAQRDAEAREEAARKRRAIFFLIAVALGGSIAYLLGQRVAIGMIIGALAGQILSKVFALRRSQRLGNQQP
jgi:hypothetical protein